MHGTRLGIARNPILLHCELALLDERTADQLLALSHGMSSSPRDPVKTGHSICPTHHAITSSALCGRNRPYQSPAAVRLKSGLKWFNPKRGFGCVWIMAIAVYGPVMVRAGSISCPRQ